MAKHPEQMSGKLFVVVVVVELFDLVMEVVELLVEMVLKLLENLMESKVGLQLLEVLQLTIFPG
jgi:hypothetical protein